MSAQKSKQCVVEVQARAVSSKIQIMTIDFQDIKDWSGQTKSNSVEDVFDGKHHGELHRDRLVRYIKVMVAICN